MQHKQTRAAIVTGSLVALMGLGASTAAAESPATANSANIELGTFSQDSETGYRFLAEFRRGDGMISNRWQLEERDYYGGTYSRFHAGLGWGVQPDADTHWKPVEIGFRSDRFADTVNIGGNNRVAADTENGLYVATDYETWWDDFGARGRVQYADVGDSGGVDVRAEGLYAFNDRWQVAVAYESANSGPVEEDIITAGARFNW